jgi:hypothetical protein
MAGPVPGRLDLTMIAADYAGRSITAASTTGFDSFSSAHQQPKLDDQSLLHRQQTSTASHRLTNSLSWTINRCFIDNRLRLLLIMCYGADSLARCEAKNGKVRKKQAPQCFTGFKACFCTKLTDGLDWTLDHCCIND